MNARLGIDGLPERFDGLAAGMIYGIGVDQQALRISLLARTLARNLDQGNGCALVTPNDAGTLLKKAALVGVSLQAARARRQLAVVESGAASIEVHDVLRNLRKLTADLGDARLRAGSLVVIDRADLVLGLSDRSIAVAALRTLQDWAGKSEVTVVALFSRPAGVDGERALASLAESLAGHAEIAGAGDATTLAVDHWFAAGGAAAATTFALTLAADGALLARRVEPAAESAAGIAAERGIVTRRAADGFGALPEGWRLADGFLDAIDMAASMQAGTVVLDFGRGSTLKELAQAIAALRAAGSSRMRVVVRETSARLRLSQVIAVLRLGASLIVPKDTGGTAARLMAESLRGSAFVRPVETDVAAVLAQARADAKAGAMPIDRFRATVEQLLEVSASLDMPHTLVRCSLLTQAAFDAVLASLGRGARDIAYAAHDRSLWIFLFGCAPEHAEPIMARLLGSRFLRLLAGWQAIGGADGIRESLTLLDHAVADPGDGAFPDTVPLTDPIAAGETVVAQGAMRARTLAG